MGPKKKDTGATPDPEKRRITPRKWNPVPKDDSSSSEDDIEICPICNDKNDPNNEDNKNRMIGCDGCDKWFHWGCVGISNENKPAKDDDWFCRKCARLKDSAGAWKPAKADESELDVLPARTTSRISRGGSKSEVKRGRGGKLRGGKRESFILSKSVGGTPRSPSPPEVILTPVKDNQKKEKSKKVSSNLFGSKSSVKINKDEPNSKLPTGLSMTPVKPKGGATLTPVIPPVVTLSPTEKNDGITVTSVKRGITVTPTKGISVTPSKGNTATPAKGQRVKKVVAAPENQKKSSITLGTITDSDGSGSDIEDILPGTNEGLQNSTISSSGSDQQDHEIIKIDEKKTEDKVIVIQDLDSEEETEQKSAKLSIKKSGRVTPLKIDMKKINKSPKEKDNKRKECPELKSPVSKKARGNNSDSKVSLSREESNQSIASILDSVEEESLILEGRNTKPKEDLNNVEREFTHDMDLGDPGLQNMLENIGSVDDGVGSRDNKTSGTLK